MSLTSFQNVAHAFAPPPGSGVSIREHTSPGRVPVSSVVDGNVMPGKLSN
jgi:hypothetical protein